MSDRLPPLNLLELIHHTTVDLLVWEAGKNPDFAAWFYAEKLEHAENIVLDDLIYRGIFKGGSARSIADEIIAKRGQAFLTTVNLNTGYGGRACNHE